VQRIIFFMLTLKSIEKMYLVKQSIFDQSLHLHLRKMKNGNGMVIGENMKHGGGVLSIAWGDQTTTIHILIWRCFLSPLQGFFRLLCT